MKRAGGFTLLELLAVVGLTGLVLFVAVDFYIDLSTASNAAAERTRSGRRAAAILDRVASDLHGAVLVLKEPDADRLGHPWLFYAEAGDDGADRMKFVTRNHRPRASAAHESDLELVSYALRRGEDDQLELMRWSSPHLPESLDRKIVADEGDGALLLAGQLAAFGVRFLHEEGDWKSGWDSTTLVDADQLPLAAEVTVSLAAADGEEPDGPFDRRVLIPVRPLDLTALLQRQPGAEDDEQEEDEDDENCQTVAECVSTQGLPANMATIIQQLGSFCFEDHADELAILPPENITCP